jgi:hypothetical protein
LSAKKYSNESMTVLLAEHLVAVLGVEVFLDAGGIALVQSDDVVLLPHLVAVDGAESGSETAEGGETEHRAVLDTVIGLASEGRTDGSVDDTGAAVG